MNFQDLGGAPRAGVSSANETQNCSDFLKPYTYPIMGILQQNIL